jgi:hypothetical protein
MTCDSYVRRVLGAYRTTPGTIGRTRPADRRLSEALYRQGVPLEVVESALLLATARRLIPHLTNPPPPVRSLHYFLPVITELRAHPPEPGYLDYLAATLKDVSAPPPPSL